MEAEIKRFLEETAKTKLNKYHDFLLEKLRTETREHGKSEEWDAILDSIENSENPIKTEGDLLSIGDGKTDYSNALIKLKPWRKRSSACWINNYRNRVAERLEMGANQTTRN